jgi:hypothetical protein
MSGHELSPGVRDQYQAREFLALCSGKVVEQGRWPPPAGSGRRNRRSRVRHLGPLLPVDAPTRRPAVCCVHSETSSADQSPDRDRQGARVVASANAQELTVGHVVTEVGSARGIGEGASPAGHPCQRWGGGALLGGAAGWSRAPGGRGPCPPASTRSRAWTASAARSTSVASPRFS